MAHRPFLCIVIFALFCATASSFSLVMMGTRRGKGNLKRSMDPSTVGDKATSPTQSVKSLNQGKGQEITGVTLPEEGCIKGWAFGKNQQMACACVDGQYYAVDGQCPRCAFDLYKGDLVTDYEAFGPDPRVACPTCATTYSLKTGKHGPALKRTGLAGFVGGLAKTATINDASRDVTAFIITRDRETEQVFCRER